MTEHGVSKLTEATYAPGRGANGQAGLHGLENAGRERCQECAAEARVRVLAGYRAGKPLMYTMCMRCADTIDLEARALGVRNEAGRSGHAGALILIGLLLGLTGALGQKLGLGRSAGFGAVQQAAGTIGVICVVLGALMRVDLVCAAGSVLLGVAVAADALGVNGTAAMLARNVAMAIGVSLIVVGLVLNSRGGREGPCKR